MSLSDDSNLDDPDFDVIQCINQRFPNEQSLASIEEHIATIREKIKKHDEEISLAVRNQAIIEQDGKKALEDATNIIQTLMQRIYEMKNQATKSEQTVNEITCDIKQLDNAKRNLTSAIIMLNNLHILVESLEKLKEICNNDKNEYRQISSILARIQDVRRQFAGYDCIPQISHMSSEIDELCNNLAEQINNDFKSVFLLPATRSTISKDDAKLIAEACLVVSLLDEKVKSELIEWYLDLQLIEYNALFKDSNLQISSLFGIDKRYAWFKKHLLEFEERSGFLFPPPWQMSEKMAIEFCKKTQASLTRVMKTYPNEVKLDSLLYAITKTTAFEALITKRFSNDKHQRKRDEPTFEEDKHCFDNIISSCFEPYFHIFTAAQEQTIQKLFEQFLDEHNKLLKANNSKKTAHIFDSSNKLFLQYKESLVHCFQLNSNSTLIDLHDIMRKYLKEYAVKILQMHIKNFCPSNMSGLNKIGTSSDTSTKMFSVATSGAAGLLQSLLQNDIGKSKIECHRVCSVILTADYCLETSQQLEKKLREKVDSESTSKIDLKQEEDLFNEVIYCCIHILIQYLEFGCEPGFSSMIKAQWSAVGLPAGSSPFVDDITSFLQTQFPLIRENLKDGLKYFVQLCNKFITVFTQKYTANIFKCKLLGQGGAEQLLLDTHILKKFLTSLPCINSDIKSAPASYTKAVIKGMSRAEMILKVVLMPHEEIDNFIPSYHKLLPESNVMEFQRILDVKGIKRNEAVNLIEVYNKYEPKA